ncbi:MAG: ABC transporter ATP-binding protein [Deltaproteobacteria bacterium]|nr:ABC transporter ATP-binding protein [Deltaproteobacteria bacterium]
MEARDIHTYYGESYILQGVSIALEPGRVVGLLGRNGVGKSTLIRSLVGFTVPRRGSVVLEGRDVTRVPTHSLVRLGLGLVPQERRIFPSLTVQENLTLNARAPAGNGSRRWGLAEIYELFPILRDRAGGRGNLLSGGEQQMLAVARALMGNPRYLLMDEPSEGLSPLIVRELGRIIDLLRAEGMGILLIEQHVEFVLRHSDTVFIMNKGTLVHESSPEELRGNREVQKKYLGL